MGTVTGTPRRVAVGVSNSNEPIAVVSLPTPIGRIHVAGTASAIVGIELPFSEAGRSAPERLCARIEQTFPFAPRTRARSFMLSKAANELAQYFVGSTRGFSFRTLAIGTPFQTAAWRLLGTIPFGESIEAEEILRVVDAQGHTIADLREALDANPLAVAVPVHRVADAGSLLPSAGPAERARRWLKGHESAQHDDIKSARALGMREFSVEKHGRRRS